MCGRPLGCKGKATEFDGGATAVMCPAFDAARRPLAHMGSANKPQTRMRHRDACATHGVSCLSARLIIILCSFSYTQAPASGSGGRGSPGRLRGDLSLPRYASPVAIMAHTGVDIRPPGSDISALAETMVLLRYVELRSRLYRLISLSKVRVGAFDPMIRGF